MGQEKEVPINYMNPQRLDKEQSWMNLMAWFLAANPDIEVKLVSSDKKRARELTKQLKKRVKQILKWMEEV